MSCSCTGIIIIGNCVCVPCTGMIIIGSYVCVPCTGMIIIGSYVCVPCTGISLVAVCCRADPPGVQAQLTAHLHQNDQGNR